MTEKKKIYVRHCSWTYLLVFLCFDSKKDAIAFTMWDIFLYMISACGVRFEKMISGMYLGEIVRLLIMRLANTNLLFGGKTSDEMQTSGRFYTKYISEIEA